MSAFLFVTDLDNTLVGDDVALNELNQQLSQHRQQFGTKIVYATGRSLTLYRQLTYERPLLTPDALITSVGTEIYFNPLEDHFDPEWASILSDGWDRDQVVAIASHYADLELQRISEQNPFKVSYYLSEQVAHNVIPNLKVELAQSGVNVKIVYSGSHDLDLLPKQGDKGLAVHFLREKWQVSPLRTVVCGDSGNDISLFSVGEERGIIVGNARIELRQWYDFNQTDYRYLAQNCYAAGILEGLKYFGFL
jgi:sucrose-6-phosphatase